MGLPKSTLGLAVTAILFSHIAHANNGVYITGKLGSSIVQLSDQKWISEDGLDETYHGGNKTKGVFGGGISVGYDFYDMFSLPIRTEFDITMRDKASSHYNLATSSYGTPGSHGYWDPDDAKNDITLNTFMANSYYDFRNSSAFTPYISLGLGIASLKHKTTYEYTEIPYSPDVSDVDSYSKSKTAINFAWSFGVGTQYTFNENLALDLSYRYLDAGKSDISYIESKSKIKVKTNDIMLGIIYRF
ncbi:outer membrane protein [Providencia manganoxydans]|uniref:Porin family protein n=1 Tax=Providencia manganoxydans TaxID=2923283 RepID=A0ABX7AE23_9GAMM|nr:outer membrane beta-barrel protein [Providencia manganoxydans]MDX4945818.1 outer membrane beta-barrel protein [Providencia manganoxydans]QQO61967.1 porin family protein [Providencia manganoxydans]HEF8774100.1 porin family protein [Providencia stuartii]